MAEEPRQRKRKMREGPAGGAKRGRQGADGRPMRKENQYQYARHAYNVMGCFVDIATSDLTDRDRKTPCLVHLPAILGLAIREDEWPLMQQSKSGAFVMPRGPMILIDDLPSFREPSRNASLDHLLKCIKQSPRYKLLMEAILDVDNGVIYDATTGSFMEVEGYEFFPGEAVQNLGKSWPIHFKICLKVCPFIAFKCVPELNRYCTIHEVINFWLVVTCESSYKCGINWSPVYPKINDHSDTFTPKLSSQS